MPRYLILRTFTCGADEMPVVGRRSSEIIEGQFPQIAWEHSHVTVSDEGQVRTFCVYSAPDRRRPPRARVGASAATWSTRSRKSPATSARRTSRAPPSRPRRARARARRRRGRPPGGDRQAATDRTPPLNVLRGDEPERLAIELCRMAFRPAALLLLRRGEEIVHRPRVIAGVPPVAGERSAGLADLGGRLPRGIARTARAARAGAPAEAARRRRRGSARA